MNLHVGETSHASSPWINHQHPWWSTVWTSVKVSHVCWIWPRPCSGRSASVVNRFSFIRKAFHRSHLLDSFPFVILWIQTLDGKLLEMDCSILRWSWEFTKVPFNHYPSFLLYSPGLRCQSVVYVVVIDPLMVPEWVVFVDCLSLPGFIALSQKWALVTPSVRVFYEVLTLFGDGTRFVTLDVFPEPFFFSSLQCSKCLYFCCFLSYSIPDSVRPCWCFCGKGPFLSLWWFWPLVDCSIGLDALCFFTLLL